MGLLDDAASVMSGRPSKQHHHKKHRSRSRSRERERHRGSEGGGFVGSIFGGEDEGRHRSGHHHSSSGKHHRGSSFSIFGGDKHHERHNSSRASFFSVPNASTRSFFGFGRSPSYYKRSPRQGFISRALRHVKRLLRDLAYYAQKHPLRVFALVIMPLVTGGALTALLARFGVRMPAGLERMLGLAARASSGDGIGLVGEAVRMAGGLGGNSSVRLERGREGGYEYERRRVEKDMFGGGEREGGGWGGGVGNLVGMAKMFM